MSKQEDLIRTVAESTYKEAIDELGPKFDDLLESRRSVRKYKPDTVIEKETIEELIRAALQAPSWKNVEASRYYAVIDPDKVDQLRTTCLPDFNQNSTKDAAAYIVTAYERGYSGYEKDGSPTNELGDKWGAYDLGLASMNILLKARDLGLDTLVMGIRDGQALREMLGIPASQDLVAVISVGFRDIDPKKPKRKEIDEVLKTF